MNGILKGKFVRNKMLNDRLYNAAMLNEIGDFDRKRTKFNFEPLRSGYSYPYFPETNSFMVLQCC